MARSSLCYRGLRYDHSQDVPVSLEPVEHVYRGHHYDAPLLHAPQMTDGAFDLIYRGTHHHHQHRG